MAKPRIVPQLCWMIPKSWELPYPSPCSTLPLQIRMPMAFDQVIGCQPQSRQSDRGLLSELESLGTHRDTRTRGPQSCRLFGKSWAGDPTNTILQEPPQPNQVQHRLKETTQQWGYCTKNSYLLCPHIIEFKPSSSMSRHHELLAPHYTWENGGNGPTSFKKKLKNKIKFFFKGTGQKLLLLLLWPSPALLSSEISLRLMICHTAAPNNFSVICPVFIFCPHLLISMFFVPVPHSSGLCLKTFPWCFCVPSTAKATPASLRCSKQPLTHPPCSSAPSCFSPAAGFKNSRMGKGILGTTEPALISYHNRGPERN